MTEKMHPARWWEGRKVGGVNEMYRHRNRTCKLLTCGGSLALSWSRKEAKGTWADQGRERADQEEVWPEDLVRTWL